MLVQLLSQRTILARDAANWMKMLQSLRLYTAAMATVAGGRSDLGSFSDSNLPSLSSFFMNRVLRFISSIECGHVEDGMGVPLWV